MSLSKPEFGVLCVLACGLALACDAPERRFVEANGAGAGETGGKPKHRDANLSGVSVTLPGDDADPAQGEGTLYSGSSLPFFEEGSGGGPALPAVSVYCGDGVLDVEEPFSEECDDGPGADADLCTRHCQVADTAVVPLAAEAPSPPERASRTLGEGRHPVSASTRGIGVTFVESHVDPPLVGLSIFDPAGDPRARIAVSAGAEPVLFANPVVAALPGGDYAVAWTDFDGDGAALGVALRRVTPAAVPDGGSAPPVVDAPLGATLSPVVFANERGPFSQYDADVIAVGSTLVVAWTDDRQAETAPDLRYRTFDAAAGPGLLFTPSSSDRILSATADVEGNVALAPFGTSFAAAWRSGKANGLETVEVYAVDGDVRWTVSTGAEGHLPGAVEDRPALVELDATHLLLAFTEGTDPLGTTAALVGRLRAAVLDTQDPENIALFEIDPQDAAYASPAIGQSQPNLARAGDHWYLAWRSGALERNANGEDLWLARIQPVLSGAEPELLLDAEYRIPRWAAGSLGDQEFPALAGVPPLWGTLGLPSPAPNGGLALAWTDYGLTRGAAQGAPDVLAQFVPLPGTRFEQRADCTEAAPCGPGGGDCDTDAECQAGLICPDGAGNGPNFGFGPDMDVCVAPHCTNGVLDADETGVDCGGADCGVCLCGDGIVLAVVGEECDDGGDSATCDGDCTFAECGDGLVNLSSGEECDDENQIDTDACLSTCVPAACGDGIVWAGVEACDEGGQTATCNADCTVPPAVWNPAHLSPVAWYFASPSDVVLESGAVAQWSDRSGNGLHLTNPNASGRPAYNATGWNGSQPTVTFAGKVLWREPWNLVPAGDDTAFTVLAVLRPALSHDGGVATFWNINSYDNVWCQVKAAHGGESVLEMLRMDDLASGQIVRGTHDLGTGRHVVAWRFSPQELKVTVDAHTTSLPQDPLRPLTFPTFVVGATSLFGTHLFHGDLSELVVVPSALSDDDVDRFRSYARQVWGGLPAGGPTNPCLNAGGQPSPPSKRCDDDNPATFGDHCENGSCVGTVPPPGSPADLAPVAWYFASESELTLDSGPTSFTASQWFDRSPEARHVMQAHPGYRPVFAANGWNESKPTVVFNGAATLGLRSWTGAPGGQQEGDGAFTLLAVVRSAQSQTAGFAGWFHTETDSRVFPRLVQVGSETLLGLSRTDDFGQNFTGTTDIKTERHVLAWRYTPEVIRLTVDDTTVTSPSLESIGPVVIDAFNVGSMNPNPVTLVRGDISELAVIPRSISDGELAAFRTYAQATWGSLAACGWGPGDSQCQPSEYCDYDGVCKPRPCNLSDPFISLVSVFPSDVYADGITFSADGLTAFVAVGGSNGPGNIHRATRPNTSSAFTLESTPLANVNTAGDERGPWLSKDGLRLYFSTTNTPTGDAALVVSTRPSPSAAFGPPQLLPNVDYATDLDMQPSFALDEQLLYFSSQRPAGHDIYYSTHTNGVFSAPQVDTAVSSSSEDSHPVLSRDGLRIYFRSKRVGPDGDGDGSIYMAERASTSEGFGTPTFLGVLNTTGNEFPVALSADECSLFIGANRHTGLGGVDVFRLYEIKRGTPPAQMTLYMTVTGNPPGSVGAPFNCSIGQTCPVTQPFGTELIVWGNRTGYWSGGCAPNGAPGLSTDGVAKFTIDPECTVEFP